MNVCTSTGVHDDDLITLYGSAPDDLVSITFGDEDTREQITIDFYDPAPLDRLAALATEGARRLRAMLAEAESGDEPAEVDGDRPAELVG